MKILILGAGRVGQSTAHALAGGRHDITLVDRDETLLAPLNEHLDISTVTGLASSAEVLRMAGAADADMLLAVTDSDEVNMTACQIAHTLFHTPVKIARVRAPMYLGELREKIFCNDAIPIDHIISPEEEVSNEALQLVECPGSLQVINFAGGKVRLVGLRAYTGGALVGHELRELKEHLPAVHTRVLAIYRNERVIIPGGRTKIEADDEVFFIATAKDIKRVMQELRVIEEAGKRIIIAGGGNIGFRLAGELAADGFQVKLIEHGEARAAELSVALQNCMVLHGDAADENLLREENIESAEMFCALTDDDKTNIFSAMLAKNLGARRTMALINDNAYTKFAERELLDIAFSPSHATVSKLLSYVRRGDVQAVHTLRGGGEAIEVAARGEYDTSHLAGRRLCEIKLPRGAAIGAVLRADELLRIEDDLIIKEGDHLIIFVTGKKGAAEVEKLLQVPPTFF